ncbi:MAG: hypothetical protein IT376_14375 [Polyangiaceae bacterium]|nr:hypothetical protein [Polyangiaceae bacterium]
MRSRPSRDAATLLRDVAWAIDRGLEARELVPMLGALVQRTAPTEAAGWFARVRLAALVVEVEPWRAALLAREALRARPDAFAYGVLGLALTVQGHPRAAAAAYRRALALDPACPSVLHNLGHLTDVVFDQPRAALALLARACRAAPHDPEIAASLAHALARAAEPERAARVLARVVGAARAAELLRGWAARGLPPSTSG